MNQSVVDRGADKMGDDDAMVRSMGLAGVKKLYMGMKLPDFGKSGEKLRDHIITDDFKRSMEGLAICGNAAYRLRALPVLTKELVLLQYSVRLVSLRDLTYMLNTDSEDLLGYDRVEMMCVDWFQTDSEECPYTWSERNNVEQFLIDRVEIGLRVSITSHFKLSNMPWWSGNFKEFMVDFLREWNFGRV